MSTKTCSITGSELAAAKIAPSVTSHVGGLGKLVKRLGCWCPFAPCSALKLARQKLQHDVHRPHMKG